MATPAENPDEPAALAEMRKQLSQADTTVAGVRVPLYPRQDDQFLLAFLRARKFEVPRAVQLFINCACGGARGG